MPKQKKPHVENPRVEKRRVENPRVEKRRARPPAQPVRKTEALRRIAAAGVVTAAVAAAGALPPRVAAADMITEFCAAMWGGNFTARETCEASQEKVALAVQDWCDTPDVFGRFDREIERMNALEKAGKPAVLEDPFVQIYRLCTDTWRRDGLSNFDAMALCLTQQTEAYERLAR